MKLWMKTMKQSKENKLRFPWSLICLGFIGLLEEMQKIRNPGRPVANSPFQPSLSLEEA